MADSGFSSKRQTGLMGSLVLRVLLVCLTFVAVPLLIYSYLIYRQEQAASHLPKLLFLIFILGGALTLLITRRMAKPLADLSETMDTVAGGDLEARYTKDPMGFEINVLGSHFNHMVDSLLRHRATAEKERIAREVLSNELKIGQEIQKSLFPKSVPDFPGLEIAAGFIPAKEVAGDFYDLFKVGSKLMIVIADASGKGISACLYSLAVRSILRAEAASSDNLSEIIRRTNNLFCLDTDDSGTFVTAWIGLFDSSTYMLEYSSCGHPFAILKHKNGSIKELATAGTALGVVPFDKVETSLAQLSTHDQLLLYTDGIIDTHDPHKHLFGKKRLLELVSSGKDASAQKMIDRLFAEIESFSSGARQHDDLTLLAFKIQS